MEKERTDAFGTDSRNNRRSRRPVLRLPVFLLLMLTILAVCAGCRKNTAATDTVQANPAAAASVSTAKTADGTDSRAEQTGTSPAAASSVDASLEAGARADTAVINEDEPYFTKSEVALYLHTYGKLPGNYITKTQAEKKGWDSDKGNLWDVLPGMSIGGGSFGNYEGLLPEASGRRYYECDIDYQGGYRNAKRIIWFSDGLIFYTEDHYKTFEQLY